MKYVFKMSFISKKKVSCLIEDHCGKQGGLYLTWEQPVSVMEVGHLAAVHDKFIHCFNKQINESTAT
jgi:hypothetical protein